MKQKWKEEKNCGALDDKQYDLSMKCKNTWQFSKKCEASKMSTNREMIADCCLVAAT